MDTNFEDYGIKLWHQKNKKNELKQKTNKTRNHFIENIVLAIK